MFSTIRSRLIVIAVLANLAVMAFVLVPSAFGRPGTPASAGLDAVDQQHAEVVAAVSSPPSGFDGDVPTWAYDRVVRIVSWVFILATSTIIAVTGLYPRTQSEIFVLLALSMFGLYDLRMPSFLMQKAGARSGAAGAYNRLRRCAASWDAGMLRHC